MREPPGEDAVYRVIPKRRKDGRGVRPVRALRRPGEGDVGVVAIDDESVVIVTVIAGRD